MALPSPLALALSVCLALLAVVCQGQAPGQWRAAVYEHIITEPAMVGCTQRVCNREEAIAMVTQNLDVLLAQVQEAAGQGAQLILLPEDGIHGYGFTRETIPGFLEPLLPEGESPCDMVEGQGLDWLYQHYVQVALSCAAKEFSLYVAAALGTIDEGKCTDCGSGHGDDCYYNTLVVYDPQGSLLGHYHKFNLWTSELPIYDISSSPSLVVLDTEMGRLGLAICEDLLWKSPVVELAESLAIDTLILPLSWWDSFPHQLAHSSEDAWARGLQVNLLAANTHSSAGWTSGSGIFSPSGHRAVYHNVTQGSSGQLLVADLEVRPSRSPVSWGRHALHHAPNTLQTQGVFSATVYDDTYSFVPMDRDTNVAKVCSGDLCCLADFAYLDSVSGDVFSLGVFSGNHTKDGSVAGSFYLEMCTVIKCDPADVAGTCEQDQLWDYTFLVSSDTVFSRLELSGTFSEDTRVFPEVLFDQAELRPDQVSISPSGVLSLTSPSSPLLSLSLFGRRYSGDSPYPESFCPGE